MMCAKEQDVALIATMVNVLDVKAVVIILVLPAQVLATVGFVEVLEQVVQLHVRHVKVKDIAPNVMERVTQEDAPNVVEVENAILVMVALVAHPAREREIAPLVMDAPAVTIAEATATVTSAKIVMASVLNVVVRAMFGLTSFFASWITLKDAEGKNSGKITITAEANTSEDSRSATLIISYGGKSEYVSITQKGVPVNLSISPDDFSIHRNGGEKTLRITSDTYWTVSTDATWLSLSKYSGNGNGEVVVTASANEGNARSAIIKFTHNKTEVPVKVSQDAKLYVPLEIRNVIIMNTTGGTGSSSIINMEKDGLYASKLVYLSERLIIYYKTAGNYRVTRKWYCPGSTEPDCYSWYDFPSYLSTYDNPFVVEFYNNYWKPEYYKTGTHRWEYYYEDELIYTKTFTVY